MLVAMKLASLVYRRMRPEDKGYGASRCLCLTTCALGDASCGTSFAAAAYPGPKAGGADYPGL